MDFEDKYRIPYTGLKEGKHTFEFTAGEEFFDHYEYEFVENVKLTANIELQKMSTMLILDVILKGSYETQCDRCGDDLVQEFDSENRLFVKFGEGESTDENIIILNQSEHILYMALYIFEFFVTSVQSRHVHEKEECNQEVLNKIESLRVTDEDSETETNPIWDKLKEIKK